jgi:uncharacterized protein (TIGR03663 family)
MTTGWPENEKSTPWWLVVAFTAILLIGGWLRFEQIGVKPLHHDEGVNSFFLLNLARGGEYRYNPDNYHGPTLYYLGLASLYLFGENELALRFWPAAFGLLTVGLVWLFRRELGPTGTLVAALLLTLSTGLVYYSRDFIHESIFGGLTLAVVGGAWRFNRERHFRWVLVGALATGLLFATKETAMVTAGVVGLAIIAALGWDLIRQRTPLAAIPAGVGGALAARRPSVDHALAALIIFIFVNLVFYSSIFTNGAGVGDALRSPWRWTMRSGSEHVKSFWYYAGILLKLELPLLVGAVVGGMLIAWRGTRFWLFIGAWTLGIFLAYSLIGYKTPWLIVNLLIPMGLLGGHAAQRLADLLTAPLLRLLAGTILVIGLVGAGRLTRTVSLIDHSDNRNQQGFLTGLGRRLKIAPYLDDLSGYVYVQTEPEVLQLVELIAQEAATLPTGAELSIYVASPDYWPLPWYLRNYRTVSFSGQLPPFDENGDPAIGHDLIIVNSNQLADFANTTGFRVSPTSYALRPGASLVLLVREAKNNNHQSESETLP